MKKLVTMLFAVLMVQSLLAVPAAVKVVEAKQADGTSLKVRLRGDEFFHWRTTESGSVPIVKQDGFYYYARYDSNGKIMVTPQRVGQQGRIAAAPRECAAVDMRAVASQLSMSQRLSRLGGTSHVTMTPQRVASAREGSSASVVIPTMDAGFPSTGAVKSIVLLVEFKDVRFSVDNPHQAFDNLLNQEGYSAGVATGSAADYFNANSGNTMDVTFDVYGPYTLPETMRFYGNNVYYNDCNPQQMVIDGAELADAAGVDFSQYDYNHDGVVDNIFVYYAGHNEAEGGPEESVWPHKWNVPAGNYFDGLALDVYACSSELRSDYGTLMAGIGTFCHEFSHVFGLADHYDVDYTSGGYSEALGYYDIMCGGSYNNDGHTPPMYNGLELLDLGWAEPKFIDYSQDVVQQPISKKDIYVVGTEKEGEFFVIENRRFDDNVWDEYLPGEGLLITQVDRTPAKMDRWTVYNSPNSDPKHECFKFIPASGADLNTGYADWSDVGYPSHKGNNEWNNDSTPRAESWNEKDLAVGLYDISESGLNAQYYAMNYVDEDSDKSHIKGRVVDATSGAGIPNIQLTIKEYNPAYLTSSYGATSSREDGVAVITTDNRGYYSYGGLQYQHTYTLSYIAGEDDKYLSVSTLLTGLMLHDMNNHDATVNAVDDLKLAKNTLSELDKFSYADADPRQVGYVGDAASVTSRAIELETSGLVGHAISYGSVVYGTLSATTTKLTLISVGDDDTLVTEGYAHSATSIPDATNVYTFDREVVVYPDRKYYVVATFQGEIAVDKGAADEGGNLEFVDNNSFEASGDDGVLCISVYLSPDRVTSLQSVTLAAEDSTKEPLLGVEYQLCATFTPKDCPMTDLTWSSSDSEIASVDDTGCVVFNAVGEVTITAQSCFDDDIKATKSLTCESKRVLMGKVTDNKHIVVGGQEVVLYPLISSFEEGALSKSFTRAADGEPLTVTTDANGEFVCEVVQDFYELVVESKNFSSYNTIVEMDEEVTHRDVLLQSNVVASRYYFTHFDQEMSGIEHFGANGESYTVYEAWQPSALSAHVGQRVETITAELADDATIRFSIAQKEGGLLKEVYVSEPIVNKGYALLTHDLPEQGGIVVEASAEYYVGYHVDQSSILAHPSVLRQGENSDGSYVVLGSGEMKNVVSDYLDNEPYAWSVGFYLHDEVPFDTFKLFVGQVDASLEWYSQDFTKFRVTLTDAQGDESFECDGCKFEFTSLTPDSSYDVSVEGAVEGDRKYTPMFETSFKSVARKVDFPGILLSDYEWNVGDVVDLKAINLNDGDVVEWFVNGDKLMRPSIVLVEGEHKIECHVERNDGSEYQIVRYINVK